MIRPDLPAAEDLTSVERRWLALRLARLRDLAGMALGTYAEAVVADALPGSLEAADGTARVDIAWLPEGSTKEIAVEVKHSRGGQWGVSASNARENGERIRRRRADVYVLADHSGPDHRIGWRFYVVPRWRLDGWDRKNVSASRLRNWNIGPVDAEALPAAVLAAAETPGDYQTIVDRDQLTRRIRRSSGDPRS